ncbi:hypothetical protein FH972_027007 [Carpinus fangiana]|uniref:Uncharacterized protein n=1 Tax=Carpinus fangiana TaxID=176857 RepID=A0A5N6L860_9ROSI|nr:hypothetical protein FH972_027007 [Carpinus fangiana]
MARAGKRLALDKLDEAESPFLRDIPKTCSETRQEELESLRVMLRKEKYLLSSLWKKFPKLSSDWSERNSEPNLLIFDSIVDLVLNSNPVVAVVGKDEIILAAEKKSTYLGLDGCSLPLNGRTILAFAGLMEHALPLEERVDIEIAEYKRLYDVLHLIPISPEHVALKVADVQYQLCHTKTGGGYPLFTFIASFDIFTGQPELYVVDFRGRVGRFGAYAARRGLELMNKFLCNNYQKEFSARELAIRALLETKKAASKAPTHIRVVQEEREKTKKAAPKKGKRKAKKVATEVESLVDEFEAEKVASKAPTHKRALEKEQKNAKKVAAKKERRRAKKAIAEAAMTTLPDEPLVDVTISNKMDLPEEQKMGVEKSASEAAPLVDVAAADQMALPEEPQVGGTQIREEKPASEAIPFGKFGVLRREQEKITAAAEAAKKAPLEDVADLTAHLDKLRVDLIEIGEERATYEAHAYSTMYMPFGVLMRNVEKMRGEKVAAEAAKKALQRKPDCYFTSHAFR